MTRMSLGPEGVYGGEKRLPRRSVLGIGAAGAGAWLAACGGGGPGGAAVTGPLKMAFVPFAEAHKLVTQMQPFVSLLEQDTGYKYETSVPTSYAATIEALGAKQVDIAWFGPLAYVIANQKYGAELLGISLFNKGGTMMRTYPGGIIVRADSPYKSVQDLKGKKFAFTDPTSASGYLYPMDYLVKQGIGDPNTFFSQVLFAGGHDKVAAAVMTGQVDAGAIYTDILDRLAQTTFPTVQSEIRVLVQTADIPNDNVAARQGLPREGFTKLQSGLLKVAAMPEGARALKDGLGIDGLGRGDDKDYDPLRNTARVLKLDLEKAIQPAPTATKAP
jgi:phosphonate transport system substrate-binding protein